jgi:hypothetical protein
VGLSYDIDVAAADVRIIGTGQLSMPAIIDILDQVTGDPRFDSHFAVLLDIRHADYRAEMNDGTSFVAALKRRKQEIKYRFALVVPETLELLARLICLLAQDNGLDRIKCFTDIGEADRWCGLSI